MDSRLVVPLRVLVGLHYWGSEEFEKRRFYLFHKTSLNSYSEGSEQGLGVRVWGSCFILSSFHGAESFCSSVSLSLPKPESPCVLNPESPSTLTYQTLLFLSGPHKLHMRVHKKNLQKVAFGRLRYTLKPPKPQTPNPLNPP